jgi:hypothetical protein
MRSFTGSPEDLIGPRAEEREGKLRFRRWLRDSRRSAAHELRAQER